MEVSTRKPRRARGEALAETVRESARKPRYVKAYRDRHGQQRFYYRRPGFPVIPLDGELFSPEFNASYAAAEMQRRIAPSAHGRRGFVYVVQVRGFDLVKIGYSTAPTRRIAQLEQGSGMAGGLVQLARFPSARRVELMLHRQFKNERLFGEWFRLSGPVADWLSTLTAAAAA